MWTRIRLLLQDQSDLDLHCLKRLKHLSRLQRQTTFIEIDALVANVISLRLISLRQVCPYISPRQRTPNVHF